jgi:hypothetical protein
MIARFDMCACGHTRHEHINTIGPTRTGRCKNMCMSKIHIISNLNFMILQYFFYQFVSTSSADGNHIVNNSDQPGKKWLLHEELRT